MKAQLTTITFLGADRGKAVVARFTPQEVGILKKAQAIAERLHDACHDLTHMDDEYGTLCEAAHNADVGLSCILGDLEGCQLTITHDPILIRDAS